MALLEADFGDARMTLIIGYLPTGGAEPQEGGGIARAWSRCSEGGPRITISPGEVARWRPRGRVVGR